jgi:C4-dicarboxylate transporter/malic acid transport protein
MKGLHGHPAWFGAVMGTGALALVTASMSDAWSAVWLQPLAGALLLLATVLAPLLWPRYVRRLHDREALQHELSDPGHGAMLATFPAGLLILAVAWARVGPWFIPEGAALTVDAVLLSIGAIVALVLSAAWATSIARSGAGLEGVNGGWLIPPVMNLIVPLGLAPLAIANPDHAELLLVIGFAFLGIGTVLFLALLSLLVARLALRPVLPPQMAPSLWIPLAPAGVLGLSTLRLSQAAAETGAFGWESASAAIAVVAMGIGFGLWWALFAGIDLLRARREGFTYHPGWWGFVFPLAAMALSITALSVSLGSWPILLLGTLASLVVAVVWVNVSARSLQAIVRERRSG